MYYNINWHITIGNYQLAMLDSCEIVSSVELLADTAKIVLPAMVNNKVLDTEKIVRGDKVNIWFGYNQELVKEFSGYLQTITNDGGNIVLTCEDAIYLTRKPIANKAFTNTDVNTIVGYLAAQIGGLSVNCTYNMQYDKFIIYKATAYDVLKKIQDETKANIYLKNNEINLHPAFVNIAGRVVYDFAINIEQGELNYRKAEDKPFEVEVEGIAADGSRTTVTVGTIGGDKRSIKVFGVTNKDSLIKRGEEEMKRLSYDGYDGSITGWLIPFASSGYSTKVIDEDYPYKTGWYYAKTVTTTLSNSGGVRKIDLGIKLSGKQ